MRTAKVYFIFKDEEMESVAIRPYNENGRHSIEANRLGEGFFATAFKGTNEKVYLMVRETAEDFDWSKEAISQWADTDNPHVPQIEKHGQYTFKGKEWMIYSMPFYYPLNAQCGEAWEIYKKLKAVKIKSRYQFGSNIPFYRFANEDGQQTIDNANIPQEYKDALQTILDAGSNYGCEYGIEFAPRNLSVDSEGRLIFRDILYSRELVYKMRNKVQKVC